MAANLRNYLIKNLKTLSSQPIEQLLDSRYEKFRKMGVFIDNATAAAT